MAGSPQHIMGVGTSSFASRTVDEWKQSMYLTSALRTTCSDNSRWKVRSFTCARYHAPAMTARCSLSMLPSPPASPALPSLSTLSLLIRCAAVSIVVAGAGLLANADSIFASGCAGKARTGREQQSASKHAAAKHLDAQCHL